MSMIIETDRLTRRFRIRGKPELTAVDELSLQIEAGESVGYIGANGAGKSTTIKMLVGILVPSSGTIRTCGLEPVRARKELARQVGVVFGQRSQLWWDLPLRESFEILAAIHRLDPQVGRRRTAQLVERLEMAETLATPVRQLSLGQRMRAEIAAALLHQPPLLILDEPTIGLDVLSKLRLREFLIDARREFNTTLLLTTHDMGDIERLCDRILVVDHGRMVYDGSLAGLARTVGARRVLVVDLAEPVADLGAVPSAQTLGAEGGGLRHRYAFDPETTTVPALLAVLSQRATIRDLSIEEPEIEDVVRRIYLSQDR